MSHYYVGVAASSEKPGDKLVRYTREFIDTLSGLEDRIRFVIGGYWGLMEFIADYASSKGFYVVMVLPDEPRVEPPRRDRFFILRTELGYRSRSVVLVKTSDVLVCMGGRIGSIIEVVLAYSFGKPVIVLKDTGLDTDRLYSAFPYTIDSRLLSRLYYVGNGVEAAVKVREVLME